MRYMVIKYVDAINHEEAIKKSKKVPVHEVVIHSPTWEKSNYSLKDIEQSKIGFK